MSPQFHAQALELALASPLRTPADALFALSPAAFEMFRLLQVPRLIAAGCLANALLSSDGCTRVATALFSASAAPSAFVARRRGLMPPPSQPMRRVFVDWAVLRASAAAIPRIVGTSILRGALFQLFARYVDTALLPSTVGGETAAAIPAACLRGAYRFGLVLWSAGGDADALLAGVTAARQQAATANATCSSGERPIFLPRALISHYLLGAYAHSTVGYLVAPLGTSLGFRVADTSSVVSSSSPSSSLAEAASNRGVTAASFAHFGLTAHDAVAACAATALADAADAAITYGIAPWARTGRSAFCWPLWGARLAARLVSALVVGGPAAAIHLCGGAASTSHGDAKNSGIGIGIGPAAAEPVAFLGVGLLVVPPAVVVAAAVALSDAAVTYVFVRIARGACAEWHRRKALRMTAATLLSKGNIRTIGELRAAQEALHRAVDLPYPPPSPTTAIPDTAATKEEGEKEEETSDSHQNVQEEAAAWYYRKDPNAQHYKALAAIVSNHAARPLVRLAAAGEVLFGAAHRRADGSAASSSTHSPTTLSTATSTAPSYDWSTAARAITPYQRALLRAHRPTPSTPLEPSSAANWAAAHHSARVVSHIVGLRHESLCDADLEAIEQFAFDMFTNGLPDAACAPQAHTLLTLLSSLREAALRDPHREMRRWYILDSMLRRGAAVRVNCRAGGSGAGTALHHFSPFEAAEVTTKQEEEGAEGKKGAAKKGTRPVAKKRKATNSTKHNNNTTGAGSSDDEEDGLPPALGDMDPSYFATVKSVDFGDPADDDDEGNDNKEDGDDDEWSTASSSSSLSPSEINDQKKEKENEGDDDRSCAVCLLDIAVASQDHLVTRCGHVFHTGCLVTALTAQPHGRCPMCNASLCPPERCAHFLLPTDQYANTNIRNNGGFLVDGADNMADLQSLGNNDPELEMPVAYCTVTGRRTHRLRANPSVAVNPSARTLICVLLLRIRATALYKGWGDDHLLAAAVCEGLAFERAPLPQPLSSAEKDPAEAALLLSEETAAAALAAKSEGVAGRLARAARQAFTAAKLWGAPSASLWPELFAEYKAVMYDAPMSQTGALRALGVAWAGAAFDQLCLPSYFYIPHAPAEEGP